MIIHKATLEDIPTLVRSIWISEHTGNELYSYPMLFDLSEEAFTEKFTSILKTETEGHNLTYRNFWVCKVNGEPAGALSFFLEGSNGSSSHIATGVLMEHFSREELSKAFQKLARFKSIQLPKGHNVYQTDSGSVFPGFRGQDIFGKMLRAASAEASPDSPPPIEIQAWAGNIGGIKTFEKAGLTIKQTKLFEGTDRGRVLLSNY